MNINKLNFIKDRLYLDHGGVLRGRTMFSSGLLKDKMMMMKG